MKRTKCHIWGWHVPKPFTGIVLTDKTLRKLDPFLAGPRRGSTESTGPNGSPRERWPLPERTHLESLTLSEYPMQWGLAPCPGSGTPQAAAPTSPSYTDHKKPFTHYNAGSASVYELPWLRYGQTAPGSLTTKAYRMAREQECLVPKWHLLREP